MLAIRFPFFYYFNPLPRKEGDSQVQQLATKIKISIHSLVKRETAEILNKELEESISIHSLVKRETISKIDGLYPPADFNPLPRKEGD